MKIQFFGDPNAPLLGAYHPPRTNGECVKSVVICPPLGQEYTRTHWALRLLANQLSRRGIHVLRFDYRGHGDSFGGIEDVSSLAQWMDDLATAIDFLKQESGSSGVALLGLRAGAALAAEVAHQRPDVHSFVAWEKITDGSDYLNELRKVHQTMIDLWFRKVTTVNDESFEELLGCQLQRMLLNEIRDWRVRYESLSVPQLYVELASDREDAEIDIPTKLQKVLSVDDEDTWGKLCMLEAAWLRPKTTQLIVNTVEDLFVRLEKSRMLTPKAPSLVAEAVS